ncbi:cupin domain-containing protein [Chitinophaga arvensicola]|uniref:Cupin domain-containing protein n=1 Tax=Chitinophaga arvensicola TaxID=29529 RepID=A0A1I0Q4U5_9BACT|nr:cupin domain-containing protein [Chitinophaga arvensicola]SEW21817.1 Cupin domain-containing protein [Chitinophaga arvensicola]
MTYAHFTTACQITNHVTGQVIRFLPSAEDNILEMETTYRPFSQEPPVHYHPFQEEYFQVLSGELTVRLDGEIKTYREGAFIHIKPRVRHSMWNGGLKPAIVSWSVSPGMNTADFLQTMFLLSNEGATNAAGVPALPVMLFLLRKYRKVFCLDKPPAILLQLLYALFMPIFLIQHYPRRFHRPVAAK